MTINFYKNPLAAILLVLIFFLVAPKSASAAVPTFEVNPKITGGVTGTAISTGATITQIVKEWIFEKATEILKRQILNMIVDQIVQWIQGGGKPKFITDWPAFFRDAVDQAGGRFIQQIGLGRLCSPFKFLLSAAFIPIPTFAERSSCTLSQVGVNIENFLKDFNSGGWVAWREMVLKPQNNVYGAYIMAWDQYELEKSAAAKAAEAEAQAGKGFLSVKKCIASHNEEDEAGQGVTVCDKYEIVTPGAVVGDLAAKAVGSDIDYIVNADDFAAYVAAITNAILNRMFAEGVGLLHTALSSDSGGGNATSNASSSQAQCNQLLGTIAYNDCINAIQSGTDIREFQKNYLISLIDHDLAYQNQLLGTKQTTLIILNQSIDIIDRINQLEECQDQTPFDLVQVRNAASNTANQITQIQSDIIALQTKQQQIRTITETIQILSLWNQVANVVNPTITQTLAIAAQEETNQKQQEMDIYQDQLSSCQPQQQQSIDGE